MKEGVYFLKTPPLSENRRVRGPVWFILLVLSAKRQKFL